MNLPADHLLEPVPPLRDRPGERRVVRTRVAGRPCVTRILLAQRVPPRFAQNLKAAALRGQGDLHGLPRSVELTFAGYRCAARLPAVTRPPRWPRAVAAGVTDDGFAFVTTEWIEGRTAQQLLAEGVPDARAMALDVLRALAELHAGSVVYGDLKPENVVWTPEERAALIDLDTMREVPDALHGAPTLDITRAWAAPEQSRDQLAFLASDLWAWAALVRRLFGGAPPEAWLGPLDACRATDPRRRPTTASLLGHLEHGEPLIDWHGDGVLLGPAPTVDGTDGGDGTERVPDLGGGPATERVPDDAAGGGTERVADEAAAPPRSPRIEPPAAPARGGCGRWLLGALATVAVCCGLPGVAADLWNTATVDTRADELLVALRRYKTERALNDDPTQIARLREMAELPGVHWPTPRFAAARALALVWGARLQDADARWDADAFARLERVVADGGDRREAALARATLYGAACRLRHDTVEAAAWCSRAVEALDRFFARTVPDDTTGWMVVEARWVEVQVKGVLAADARKAGTPDAAARLAEVLARCEDAEPWLDHAPVNGKELVEDCLYQAGQAPDIPRYVRWGTWLAERDQRGGTTGYATLEKLYEFADPACAGVVTLKRDRKGNLSGYAISRSVDPWCLAVGHAARGCPDASRQVMLGFADSAPTRPWSTLEAVLPATSRADCPR